MAKKSKKNKQPESDGMTYTYPKLSVVKREYRKAEKLVCSAASCPMTNPNKDGRSMTRAIYSVLGTVPSKGAVLRLTREWLNVPRR